MKEASLRDKPVQGSERCYRSFPKILTHVNFLGELSSNSDLIQGSGLGQQYGSNLSIASSAPTQKEHAVVMGKEGGRK